MRAPSSLSATSATDCRPSSMAAAFMIQIISRFVFERSWQRSIRVQRPGGARREAPRPRRGRPRRTAPRRRSPCGSGARSRRGTACPGAGTRCPGGAGVPGRCGQYIENRAQCACEVQILLTGDDETARRGAPPCATRRSRCRRRARHPEAPTFVAAQCRDEVALALLGGAEAPDRGGDHVHGADPVELRAPRSSIRTASAASLEDRPPSVFPTWVAANPPRTAR